MSPFKPTANRSGSSNLFALTFTLLMTGLLFSGQAKAACGPWQPVDALDVASQLEFLTDFPIPGEATIGCLTSGNTSVDIIVPASVTDSVTGITYSVTQLGTNAFYYVGAGNQLRSITLPNTLRIIEYGALSHNYVLDSLIIPASVVQYRGCRHRIPYKINYTDF